MQKLGFLVQLLATAILIGIHFKRIDRFGQSGVQGPRRKEKHVNPPTWLSRKPHAVPVFGWCGRLLGRPQGQEGRALKGCLCCRLDSGTGQLSQRRPGRMWAASQLGPPCSSSKPAPRDQAMSSVSSGCLSKALCKLQCLRRWAGLVEYAALFFPPCFLRHMSPPI